MNQNRRCTWKNEEIPESLNLKLKQNLIKNPNSETQVHLDLSSLIVNQICRHLRAIYLPSQRPQSKWQTDTHTHTYMVKNLLLLL